MKSYRKELWFETRNRRELINITPEIEKCLSESRIKEGFLLCNAMHITSSVFINDDEKGLHNDFEVWLEGLAPEKPYSRYKHNSFEDNADAHLKRTIMWKRGCCCITNGSWTGPWDRLL
jgi:secondary thiamine-phosphate synthase enzyme